MMKFKRTIFSVLLIFVICAGVAPAQPKARAAAGEYTLKGDQVYRTVKGRTKLLEDVSIERMETDAGFWAWFLADPEAPGMKGTQLGLRFFRGKEGKPAGFLPMEEGATSFCSLTFSPSGDKMLVSWGGLPVKHLSLYFIDRNKGFVEKASFETAEPPFWIDPNRFAFSTVDSDKGPRVEGMFDLWWCSIQLYDCETGKTTLIREATATKNYALNGYDRAKGALDITESFVNKAKDWEDEDKINDKELSVPVPAAR